MRDTIFIYYVLYYNVCKLNRGKCISCLYLKERLPSYPCATMKECDPLLPKYALRRVDHRNSAASSMWRSNIFLVYIFYTMHG